MEGASCPSAAKRSRLRRVEQRRTVQRKGIEEERRERQLAPHRVDVEAASEAAHRDLERQRTAVRAKRDDLAVQDDLAGRQGARDLDHLGHGGRDVAQVARVRAHLVARLVHLDARAIELVLECRIVHACERVADVLRGVGQHRLHGLEDLDGKPIERLRAVVQSSGGDLCEAAGHHRRTAHAGGRQASRARDGLDEHTLECSLPQLAEEQAYEEVLFLGRRAREQLAKDLHAPGNRPRSGHASHSVECGIHVAQRERVGVGWRHLAGAADRGAADPEPSLPRLARERRDRDRHLFPGQPLQQSSQPVDLLEPAADSSNGVRCTREHRQEHADIVHTRNGLLVGKA